MPTRKITITSSTPNSESKYLVVPDPLPSTLIDSCLIKAYNQGVIDTEERNYEKMKQDATDMFKEGGKNALRTILAACASPSSCGTNSSLGGSEFSTQTLDFIHLLMHGKLPPRKIEDWWAPPSFKSAPDYCFTLCRERREEVPLGKFNDHVIIGAMCGNVVCHGEGDEDLAEHGVLTYTKHGIVESIDAFVLGPVAGTGTAILLDKSNNVWLYKTPNAVDRQLAGFEYQAAMILRSGEIAIVDKNIDFVEAYLGASWEQVESSSDEESD